MNLLYASQKLGVENSQRLCRWTVTNKNEMKRFFWVDSMDGTS